MGDCFEAWNKQEEKMQNSCAQPHQYSISSLAKSLLPNFYLATMT